MKAYSSDAEWGLTKQDILRLQNEYGPNILAEKKKKTFIGRFFDQFKDVMIIILLIAAAISFWLASIAAALQDALVVYFGELSAY